MANKSRSLFRRSIAGSVAVLVVAACAHGGRGPRRVPDVAARSDAELAKFLPAVADYPWNGWNVVQRVGRPPKPEDGSWTTTAQPSGCDTPPYADPGRIAASSLGRELSFGPSGFGGEASIGLLHPAPGSDLLAETSAWAKRCATHVVISEPPGPDRGDGTRTPEAVSVLPTRHIEGVDVFVVQLTDNRDDRYQTEGTRESQVYLANVRGIVVAGRRHDTGFVLDQLFTTTLRRLEDDRPAPHPLSDKVGADSLTQHSDAELSRLLPTVFDLPAGWSIGQSSPLIDTREPDHYVPPTDPPGCDGLPYEGGSSSRDDVSRPSRDELGRAFGVIASASAEHDDKGFTVGPEGGNEGSVRFDVEKPGADTIEDAKAWARRCAWFRGMKDDRDGGSIDSTTTLVDGQQVVAVRLTHPGPAGDKLWTLLTRIRGVLVTAISATDQPSTLLRAAIDHLRHGDLTGPPAVAPRFDERVDPNTDPPGTVPIPPATAATDSTLARVAAGRLVNPEPYHFGGYQTGDPMTRSPDYQHFRSPTGSIFCTWRRFALYCDVPHGTYPRTPKPAGLQGDWRDDYVELGWDRVVNGIAAPDPLVYAESNVLPYGSTIRLGQDPGEAECLMQSDGLTCIHYWDKRIGMHLSRENLAALPVPDALSQPTGAEPK